MSKKEDSPWKGETGIMYGCPPAYGSDPQKKQDDPIAETGPMYGSSIVQQKQSFMEQIKDMTVTIFTRLLGLESRIDTIDTNVKKLIRMMREQSE